MNKILDPSAKSSVCSSAMASVVTPNDKFLVAAVHQKSELDNEASQALANMELPLRDRVYVAGSLLPRGFDDNKKILWDVQVITPVDEVGDQVQQILLSVKEPTSHYRGSELNSQSYNLSSLRKTFSHAVQNQLVTGSLDNAKQLEKLFRDLPLSRQDGEEISFPEGHNASARTIHMAKSRISSAMDGKTLKH